MKKNILFLIIALISLTSNLNQSKAAIPLKKTEIVVQEESKQETSFNKKQELKTEKFSKKLNKLFKDDPPIKKNINGLLSFIFGLSSVVLSIVTGIGILFGIPAIILGIISLKKKEKDSWMAIVGIATGGLALLIFGLIVFIAILLLM